MDYTVYYCIYMEIREDYPVYYCIFMEIREHSVQQLNKGFILSELPTFQSARPSENEHECRRGR